MRAGALDRLVTIQRRTVTSDASDASGAAVEAWTKVAEVWAGRRDDRGREAVEAGAQRAFAERTYRIRWMAGIKAEMRVLDDGELWEIVAIAEVGRRDAIELQCTRVRP